MKRLLLAALVTLPLGAPALAAPAHRFAKSAPTVTTTFHNEPVDMAALRIARAAGLNVVIPVFSKGPMPEVSCNFYRMDAMKAFKVVLGSVGLTYKKYEGMLCVYPDTPHMTPTSASSPAVSSPVVKVKPMRKMEH